MRSLDARLDAACNWLALHPRLTCAIIVAANVLTLRLFEVVR